MTIEAGPDELYTTPARRADLPAVVELVNAAYRGQGARRGWTTEAELLDGPRVDAAALEPGLASPDHALLVLRAQSGLFACAALDRLGADGAALALLAVRPALQGNGLGRQMLAAAERSARGRFAARFLELAVLAGREELIAWLERRGYRPSGATRPFEGGGTEGGVPREGPLSMLLFRRALAAP
ncbi:MAG TPA: GNAT family N-acetyltransferase [Steroidobacteraceae bacterium]|nr:GNAT family N-acetyltransferase [Steroidobacteraceae bacterium]